MPVEILVNVDDDEGEISLTADELAAVIQEALEGVNLKVSTLVKLRRETYGFAGDDEENDG